MAEMIFIKIWAYAIFACTAKKVILWAFLSKNGKNDMVEVIFFKIWAYTIFFATKFQFWGKKLLRPLVANDEKKSFCLRSTQKCSQVSKTLLYFPDNFFNSLWPFQTNSALAIAPILLWKSVYGLVPLWNSTTVITLMTGKIHPDLLTENLISRSSTKWHFTSGK